MDKAINIYVHLLYFRENQIGFVVFETNLFMGIIFRAIDGQISSGLQGSILLNHIKEHSKRLDAGIESLSGSIEAITNSMELITTNMYRQGGAVEEEASPIDELNIISIRLQLYRTMPWNCHVI